MSPGDKRNGAISTVEAVLLWADDTDAAWLAARARHRPASRFYHEDGCRYRSWALIDLCLASMLKNAPWISRITIISPGRAPARLEEIQAINPSIPIRVVPEEEIVPERYLPQYNVFALQTFFHNQGRRPVRQRRHGRDRGASRDR